MATPEQDAPTRLPIQLIVMMSAVGLGLIVVIAKVAGLF
jgi:hypothetical protein